MRRAFALGSAVLVLTGCGGSPRIVRHGAPIAIGELVRQYPLGPTANIRADQLERTDGASVHLVQVRGGEIPHRHLVHDLVVTVVQGEGTLTVAGTPQALTAGDLAIVPRGTSHWFVRRGSKPAVALVTFTPPLDAPDLVLDSGVDSEPSAR